MGRTLCKFTKAVVAAVFINLILGCRQDMHNQPKMVPLRHTRFFTDGRSARQQVSGTVARSQSYEQNYLTTGRLDGVEGMSYLSEGPARYFGEDKNASTSTARHVIPE